KAWLQENLERRCDPKDLVAILLKNNFALSAIKAAMAATFPVEFEFVGSGSPEPTPSAIAAPPFTRERNPKLTKIDTDLLQLYTLDDFLSSRECDELVTVIDQYLRPSTLTTAEKDTSFRTS